MLTRSDVEAYREWLQELLDRFDRSRAELMEEACRPVGGEVSGGISNVPLHPADLGSRSSEEDVALGLLATERHLTSEIVAALERIEVGTFGRCEDCGGEVPEERLEALPYARRCIACARAAEEALTV